jgi:hypothetical protein
MSTRRRDDPPDDAADQHAGADAQADDHPGADVEQRHAEAQAHAGGEGVHGKRDIVEDPAKLRGEEDHAGQDQRTEHHEGRLAGLLAARVEHDHGLAGRDAVRKRQVLVLDEVLAQRHREQNAQQSRRREPDERLHPRQVDVETAAGLGGEDVECREQPAEERDLARGGAGGLNDVVLPAVVVLREQPERHEPEEGGHDRDVRAEPELEDDIRVRGADHQCDE